MTHSLKWNVFVEMELFDLFEDKSHFLMVVVSKEEGDGADGFPIAPEVFFIATRIMADQSIGRFEDVDATAVVLFKRDNDGA